MNKLSDTLKQAVGWGGDGTAPASAETTDTQEADTMATQKSGESAPVLKRQEDTHTGEARMPNQPQGYTKEGADGQVYHYQGIEEHYVVPKVTAAELDAKTQMDPEEANELNKAAAEKQKQMAAETKQAPADYENK